MAKGKEKESLAAASPQELEARLEETQDSYFRLRFRHMTNPLKNPMEIRVKRREIARIKTWLRKKSERVA